MEQFFGIDPMAAREEIRIAPRMPSVWDKASLENVKVASNKISVYFDRGPDGRVHLKVVQSDPRWTLRAPVLPWDGANVELVSGRFQEDARGVVHVVSRDSVLEFKYSTPGR